MIYTEPQTITSTRMVNVRDELVEEEYDMREYLSNARQIAMQKIEMYQ